jgi:hypothetical protein
LPRGRCHDVEAAHIGPPARSDRAPQAPAAAADTGCEVVRLEDRRGPEGKLSRERPARLDAAYANWIAKTAASSEQQELEHVPRLDIGQERLMSPTPTTHFLVYIAIPASVNPS